MSYHRSASTTVCVCLWSFDQCSIRKLRSAAEKWRLVDVCHRRAAKREKRADGCI
jgi:hypothetical protein